MLIPLEHNLYLRTLSLEDAPELFTLIERNRSHLRQWLPWVDATRTIENTIAFIESALQQKLSNHGFQCGIWYQNKLVGVIGYHTIDWNNKNVELGYWLGKEYEGKGIMTKSCRALIDYAFTEYKLHRVQIRCAVGNHRSRAVIERLGLVQEGIMREAEFLYDHYVDLFIYGITEQEWKSRTDIP
ncbi:MAG: GNAT family N-acetyltransferase [Bacteroidetes bacterium]|nr:GNAT family N-acetyltransferase [Bacteroidota bacterium]